MIMLVLHWSAYLWVCLAVFLPMAFFYAIERRRELKADAAYDGPCMVHVGTDTDGTELWCWQRSGHSGTHDDYESGDRWLSHLVSDLGSELPVPPFDPGANQYADLFAKEGYVPGPPDVTTYSDEV